MKSVRKLLSGVIDYAGLFPPAGLEMRPAVHGFSTFREMPTVRRPDPSASVKSRFGWLLNRFVVPSLRLGEMEKAAEDLLPRHAEEGRWQLSALVGPETRMEVERIRDFNQRHSREPQVRGAAVVTAIETKAENPEQIQEALAAFDGIVQDCYFEVAAPGDPMLLDALSRGQGSAKIRTGSILPGLVPSSAQLAEFVVQCARRKVSFKATAGLHHALRGSYPLTYESDSASDTMHGFVNLFLASAAIWLDGLDKSRAERILEERDLASFRFESDFIAWRDHRWQAADLSRMRGEFAHSFGSCSFMEPARELESLGLINQDSPWPSHWSDYPWPDRFPNEESHETES